MDDCDMLERDIEKMLNSFKDAVLLLSKPTKEPIDQELERLSKQICESSKAIDQTLDTTKLFDQPEEELDEKLIRLDEENKNNQEKFEQVKASTDQIRKVLGETFDEIMKIKLGEGRKMSIEEDYFNKM